MTDDGDYICLTDEEDEEEVVSVNKITEEKFLTKKSEKSYMSNYDLDILSYSFEDEDILNPKESKDSMITIVNRLTEQSFIQNQKINENSIPSSDSNISPTITSHNSSSESWVPIVPRKLRNKILNNSGEFNSISNQSIDKTSSEDFFEEEDVVLINSNNPTELPGVKCLKSSSPKIDQANLVHKVELNSLNFKSAIETPIRTDSNSSLNSTQSNSSSISSKNNIKPNFFPHKLVFRGKDLQKLKANMALDTENYSISSSDSSNSILNSRNSSVTSLEKSYQTNSTTDGFQNLSSSNQEQIKTPNQKLLSRLPSFYLNDLKLNSLPRVILKREEVDKYFNAAKEKNSGSSSKKLSPQQIVNKSNDLEKKSDLNYKAKILNRTDSIASTISIATTNSSKSSFQVKQKEDSVKLKIKKKAPSAQSSSDPTFSLAGSIFSQSSSKNSSDSNAATTGTNQINFTSKLSEQPISNERKNNSNKMSINISTSENHNEKSFTTPKSNSIEEKSSSDKKSKKRSRLMLSPSSPSSDSDFSPYQKPKKTKKNPSTDSNNLQIDHSNSKTNQITNKISPPSKTKTTAPENKKEISSKYNLKNETDKNSNNNKTKTPENPKNNNKSLSNFKIPKVAKVVNPNVDLKPTESNISPKTAENKEKKTNSSSKKLGKKKKSSNSLKKTKQNQGTSSILDQDNFKFLKTSPENKKKIVDSNEKNCKLLTLSELNEKRKQFSLGLNCAHPYFNLLFLFNDYFEKAKQAPFLNFVYLSQNLPLKSDNDHGLSVEKVLVNEKHRVGLCKLMSRSAGVLNFYRIFGFGYDLREERSPVNTVPSERIKIPGENCTEQDEINFVNSAVSRLTLSDAYILYSHLKHRINTSFRAVTVLFDENNSVINLKVKFENNKIIGGFDPSLESCVTHILHQKLSFFMQTGNFVHTNSIFEEYPKKNSNKSSIQIEQKSNQVFEAQKRMNNMKLWDSIFIEKFRQKLAYRLDQNPRQPNFSKINHTKKNLLKKNVEFPIRDSKIGIFQNYESLKPKLNSLRGNMQKAEIYKPYDKRETQNQFEKIQQKEDFNYDLDKLFFEN